MKSHGRTVKDIMTREVITVTEDTNLADVATLLETIGSSVCQLCVTAKSSASSADPTCSGTGSDIGHVHSSPSANDDDRAIRTRLIAEPSQQPWAGKVWAQDIIVSDGVVHLWFGSDETGEMRQAARVAAENVPGVRGVEEHEVPVPLMPAF